MKNWILASVAATALAGAGVAQYAFAASGDAPGATMERQHGPSGQVRAALFEARIAGMKAALKLTSEQEKAWAPFEASVRSAETDRMEAVKQRRAAFENGERGSPIDRLTMMSDHLAKASAELKQVADAAAPLYSALDDSQKKTFGPLMMTLHEFGPRGAHKGPWEHRGEGG